MQLTIIQGSSRTCINPLTHPDYSEIASKFAEDCLERQRTPIDARIHGLLLYYLPTHRFIHVTL